MRKLPNAVSLIRTGSSGGRPYTSPARAALHRGCVGRHLANRNELSVSGSDS